MKKRYKNVMTKQHPAKKLGEPTFLMCFYASLTHHTLKNGQTYEFKGEQWNKETLESTLPSP
ncbi:MAG: hypothetical protein QXR42_00035 [Candidatus Bathyarchaeia archaeon]